jgi:hypothetical protein
MTLSAASELTREEIERRVRQRAGDMLDFSNLISPARIFRALIFMAQISSRLD